MAKDIVVIVLELLLLDLESWMVDSFLSTEIGQVGEDVSFCVFLSKNVSDHDGLSWFEVPNVDVVDINDPLDCLEVCPEGFEINVIRHWLKDQEVAVLDDWNRC